MGCYKINDLMKNKKVFTSNGGEDPFLMAERLGFVALRRYLF